MIDFYAWPTPNGHKVSIMLEEAGIPYKVIPVDIGKGEQFSPDFLAISPNNRMPAIVDSEGPGGKPISLFESGAILLYLADKASAFGGTGVRGRYEVLQWLMWQMAGVGPMMGQAGHFRSYAPEKIPYAIERYTNETRRLMRVADRRLAESEWLAGEYSIADIAAFPWLRGYGRMQFDLSEMPNLARWLGAIEARPAVQRGLQLLKENERKPDQAMDATTRENLFGSKQR